MRKSKKFAAIMMAAAMVSSIWSGYGTVLCMADEAEEKTEAAAETEAEEELVWEMPERGLVFRISPEYEEKGVQAAAYAENAKGYKMAYISYYSPTALTLMQEMNDMDEADITEEIAQEYVNKLQDNIKILMEIVMVETKEYEEALADDKKPETFMMLSPAEVLGTNGDYTYLAAIPEPEEGTMSEEDQKGYQECIDYMQTVKENITYIPVELEYAGEGMPEFETEDLEGNTVTNEIFTGKKLTVVNVWGTFCNPCIEEMPDLAQWSEEMPEEVQIIGLVGDISGKEDTEHLELARKIIEKSGADYVHLIPNEDFQEMMGRIVGFPTTYFVDEQGNFVGDPVVGADVEGCRAFVEEYLGEK